MIGMISFSSARELGMRDPLRPARDAVIPLEHVLIAHPDERLDEVSARLGTERAALVLGTGSSLAPSAAPASTDGRRAPADRRARRACPSTAVASPRWPPSIPTPGRGDLEHTDGAMLVTGGSGTGKTAVLQERFARLVEAGADPAR